MIKEMQILYTSYIGTSPSTGLLSAATFTDQLVTYVSREDVSGSLE